jgi:hypothetical protein
MKFQNIQAAEEAVESAFICVVGSVAYLLYILVAYLIYTLVAGGFCMLQVGSSRDVDRGINIVLVTRLLLARTHTVR